MKVVHLHWDDMADAASDITPDPVLVDQIADPDLNPTIETGIACRVMAVRDGICPCGAPLVQLNRHQRRAMSKANGGHPPSFIAYISHKGGCLAMAEKVRTWLYQHRKEIRS